ncbi:MAG: murein biosynthesis integral membrane protein MurJ [Acidobacteria bacterium]|nr:murein biosynthesis integral membrane protein MurJ [Acidobacteriota bacterium]
MVVFETLGDPIPASMKEADQPALSSLPVTEEAEPGASQQESIVRSAGMVSAGVLLSRLSGLVRETVMARLFGASMVYDAFSLGFRIPNLTRDLFAEGALSAAFVPTFTEYLATKGKKEAAELSSLVGTAVVLVVGGFCVLGMVFSPQLVGLLAPGWAAAEPAKFQLAIELTRRMFPFLLLVALAAQAMGVLNACNQFGVPAMSSTFFNLGSVAFGLLLGFVAGPRLGITAIEGMAYGVVLGGLLQLLWQMPALHRAGFGFRPRVDWSHPGLRHIFRLMGPAILGNAAVQVNVMVNTIFASTIVDPLRGVNGPVSWLQYAFRFMQLPLGLFGVAIASATLPAISRSAAAKNLAEFGRTLSHSLGTVFLLTVPSSVGLALLGEAMIGLIYEGGRFQAYDTRQTALALSCYAVGLAGYSASKVLAPAFYALGDARVPALVSLASIVINFLVALSMLRLTELGHAGLAVATSVVALFAAVTLYAVLRRRVRTIPGRRLAVSLSKIGLAAAVMGGAVALSSHLIAGWLGESRAARLADLAVSIPLGAAIFYGLCRVARVEELEAAARAVSAPLLRVFGGARARIK